MFLVRLGWGCEGYLSAMPTKLSTVSTYLGKYVLDEWVGVTSVGIAIAAQMPSSVG